MKFFLSVKKYYFFLLLLFPFIALGSPADINLLEFEVPDRLQESASKEQIQSDDEIVNPVINPATDYCEKMGYGWDKRINENGDEDGFCIMPDGTALNEWEFVSGEAGESWSYCERKGYQLEIVEDSETCKNILSEKCAVCVRDDGSQQEVSSLLNQDSEKNEVVIATAQEASENVKVLALVLILSMAIILIVFAYFLLVRGREQSR